MLTMQPKDGLEKYLCDRAFETNTPISGTFELLPICNMNCRMCYVRISPEEMKRQGKYLSAEQWLNIGRQAVEKGTVFLLLTGGEPLLHPEFAAIYEGLRNLGICVTINTNGTMITKNLAELFQKNMPRRVNISLYGSSNKVYEDLCCNPKGFDQVMQGINFLRDKEIPIKLNYTLTPQNCSEVDEIMKISDEFKIPISVPTYMFPPARKTGNVDMDMFSRMHPKEAAEKQFEILYKNFQNAPDYVEQLQAMLCEIKQRETAEKDRMQPPGGFLCSAGVSSFWVNWKGRLTSCGMLQHPFRDLLEMDFSTGWDEISEETKKVITSEKCFYCKYRKICQTCAASAYAETGSFENEVPYHCEFCEHYEDILQEHLRQITKNP